MLEPLSLCAPLSVQIEVTAQCNQSCAFCYNVFERRRRADGPVFEPRLRRLVDRCIEGEVFEVAFSGGEPTLLGQALAECSQELAINKINTYLVTNGYGLTKELLKSASFRSVQLSLHGFSREMHDALTRTIGSFRTALAKIRLAADFCEVNGNMVAVRRNYRLVPRIAKLAKSAGASSFSVSRFTPTGQAASTRGQLDLCHSEYQELLDLIVHTNDAVMPTTLATPVPPCALDVCADEHLAVMANTCEAGLGTAAIGPGGELRPCVGYDLVLGNVIQEPLRSVWNGKGREQFLRCAHIPDVCRECEFLAMCRGGCRAAALAVGGRIDAPDPLARL